jgi:hypothetical protein
MSIGVTLAMIFIFPVPCFYTACICHSCWLHEGLRQFWFCHGVPLSFSPACVYGSSVFSSTFKELNHLCRII